MPLIYRILLTLLAALLTRLALPGFGLPHFAWVALVPFFLAQWGSTQRQRALLGLLYGVVFWSASINWLPDAMLNLMQVPIAKGVTATAMICLLHAIPYLLFGLCGRLFPDGEGVQDILRDAAFLTVLLTLSPTLFPGHLVLGLYQSPLFIQTVDLGGMPLLLFCVILVNLCGADLIRRQLAGIRLKAPCVLIAAVMAFIILYGATRLKQLDNEAAAHKSRTLTVVAVQPDIPTRAEGRDQENAITAAITATEEIVRKSPATDLVVWPEIPRALFCDTREMEQLGFLPHARSMNIPVMVNCIDGGAPIHNSAILLDGSGKTVSRYNKQLLFPFSEYIPWEKEFPLLRRLAPSVSIYRPGTEAKVMDLGFGRRLIPLLCYEAIFGGPIRKGVTNGGTILINMSNDAWFGKSNASEMHFAFLPFRVVEYRTPLVRANNSGISAYIAATGEIMPGTKTGLFQRVVQRQELFIPEKRSLYFHIGDAFLYLLIAGCALAAALQLRCRQALFRATISTTENNFLKHAKEENL